MSEGLTAEEIHQAVDRLVEQVLKVAGVEAPPVDAVALALAQLGPKAPAARRGRQTAAGEGTTEVQQQWLAAQRLGERYKPSLLWMLGLPPEQVRRMGGPSLVRLFATGLLLPTRWFAADARALDRDIPEVARRYRTAGVQRVAWRLLDLPEPCVITLAEDDRVWHRRSNAWRVRREPEPPERECLRRVREHRGPETVHGGGWTVRGWPLDEPGGVGVVLYSVHDEDFGA
jgi:hypothetical protein